MSHIPSSSANVPPRFHDKVRKFVRREQQDLPPSEVPVQVVFPSSGANDQECLLRGPANAVKALAERVDAFAEVEKREELERGYITSFGFPQKFANFLIGRRGESINKFREEFDVDIQVRDGKVEITGPKAKADAAKAKILALGKRLEDEATHVSHAPQTSNSLSVKVFGGGMHCNLDAFMSVQSCAGHCTL